MDLAQQTGLSRKQLRPAHANASTWVALAGLDLLSVERKANALLRVLFIQDGGDDAQAD